MLRSKVSQCPWQKYAAPEWIKMVQDLASQMEALPLGFSVTERQMSSLLAKLEQATGHPSCDTCRYPRRRCVCASGGSTLSTSRKLGAAKLGPAQVMHSNQDYPLLTRGTTTVSVSQSRAPASTVAAPPQGVVSPVCGDNPPMEVQNVTPSSPFKQFCQLRLCLPAKS